LKNNLNLQFCEEKNYEKSKPNNLQTKIVDFSGFSSFNNLKPKNLLLQALVKKQIADDTACGAPRCAS